MNHLVGAPAEVPLLLEPAKVLRADGLEAHEDTAHAGLGGSLDQVTPKDRLHGARSLEQAAHPAHALEQPCGESLVRRRDGRRGSRGADRQPIDLRERLVDLCV